MKKPTGRDILAALVDLLAEQENLKIEYRIEGEQKYEN